MAKRFTDTSKWRKTFFRTLTNPMKLFWLYILDECDHAGIWEVNIDLFNFQTGLKITIDDVKRHFGDKLYWFDADTKIHVPAFIDFQYGELNPENRAHLSVIHILSKKKIKPLISPLQGAYVGAKDKDKDSYINILSNVSSNTRETKLPFSDKLTIAIKRFGQYNGAQAKLFLGDDAWQQIVGLGGWARVCAMTPKELTFALKR